MGGNTKLFAKNWKKLTSDKYILDIVTNGLRLDFKEFPENRQYQFRPLKNDELNVVKAEVDKLLSKQVICESRREINDYLSSVFTRNKKDGGKRMVLNLKQFNTHITYCHFKMESIKQVIDKVPFSYLRSKGFISVVFVDDSYLQGNTYKACLHNIKNTIELLQNLGFTIHPTKSILTPTQRITFLGFVIDSVQMTLEIKEEKKSKIHNLCLETLQKEKKYFTDSS